MASSEEAENHPNVGVHDDEIRRENKEEEDFCYAIQLIGTPVLYASLKCAIELRVFDIIAEAGQGTKLSPSEIAAKLPTNNPDAPVMLDRILRLLVSYSLLTCSVSDTPDDNGSFQRLYGLLPASNFFVTNKDGVSLVPMMALVQDNVFLTSWSQLKDAILEGGIPFNRVHGLHAFEYLGLDPRCNQVFNTAMYNFSTIVMKKILELYKGFEPLKQLVDVGGGTGVTLQLITSTYPHIKAINFDLPHVIKHAPAYPGVEHVEGDMFMKVPSGDAIFLKTILHVWSDEQCIKLLKTCYKAIPDSGKVIVVETTFPVMPESSTFMKKTSQMDVFMMAQIQGGKEGRREAKKNTWIWQLPLDLAASDSNVLCIAIGLWSSLSSYIDGVACLIIKLWKNLSIVALILHNEML